MIVSFVSFSLALLLYALIRCNLNMKHIPHQSIGAYWRIMVALIVSFILGYTLYLYAVVYHLDIEIERVIISCVFLAGSCFVFLVTACSRKVFIEITALQKATQRQADMLAEEVRQRNKEIDRLITTDPVTGLNNMKSFMRRAGEEIERSHRYGSSFYILRFIVDEIRPDITSNSVYDYLLQSVSLVIRQNSRNKVDSGCRCSNNEFAMLLTNVTREQALAVSQRVMIELNAKNIDISIGLVAYHGNSTLKIDEFFKICEKAAFEAHAEGKHRIRLFERTSSDTSNVIQLRKRENL